MGKKLLPSCCFFFFFFFYFATTNATYLSNETDFQALLAFKKAVSAIRDVPVGALGSWNRSVHFCNWEGILCIDRHRNRVVSIDLSFQGLVGPLSPHLGNLSFLRSINLQNNFFNGEIPEEIGRLRRLEYVEFSQNNFSGGIPRNLSQCKKLYSLNLANNYLTGPIIPELGSSPKFHALGLSMNYLSGTIPPSLGNLTSLVELSLSQCGLQGEIPESLSQLQSLESISLGKNNLTGRIPSGLYNLSSITVFKMGFNRLQGKIPSDVGFTLPKLTSFLLQSNDFDGSLPSSLSNASSLQCIYLFSNKFSGQMLKDFHRLSHLQELLVQSNSLEGDVSFISSLTNCTELKTIDVNNNLFSGSLPDSIANFSTQLNSLYIGQNQIHGNIPSGIQNLVGLTRITFEGNYLQGPIPSGIGKLSKVQEIYLEANELTNEIPSSLGNLTLLNHVDLSYNNLRGTIPQSLSNCINLIFLDLSFNRLDGEIPRDIFSLSSISISFNLAHNAFIGSIPQEVGSLRNLVYLDLSHNRLSGVIPISLRCCLVLGWLQLQNNSLEGNIPVAFNALKGLEDLDLSQNKLSGAIPSFLGNELKLKNLNLSFNRLKGEVPTQGVFQNESAISVKGNEYLCGGLAFLKLPPCSSSSNLFKILIHVLVAGAICLTALSCIYVFVYRRRILRKIHSSMPSFDDRFLRLSYGDLLKATDGFSGANLLGSGQFSSVYRGILDDKQLSIAVKVLNLEIKGASKSFMTECSALRGIRHRNLLKILSVCQSIDFQGIDFMALVYELMDNGSMDKWLHKDYAQEEGHPQSESNRYISITQKLSIAIDIASAVEYLHHGTDSIIIHGDLKPSNILLDQNMTAHLGDFGLAKVVSSMVPSYDGNSSSVAIKGTIGYIPPEYGMTNNRTTQGDVYSFGIFVLEMFTSIKPTDDAVLNGHSSLHHLVSHALHNQEIIIVEHIIPHEDRYNSKLRKSVSCILEIGVACSMELPKDRMTMADVVRDLDKIQKAIWVVD